MGFEQYGEKWKWERYLKYTKNTKETYGAGIISMITETKNNNIGENGQVCNNYIDYYFKDRVNECKFFCL